MIDQIEPSVIAWINMAAALPICWPSAVKSILLNSSTSGRIAGAIDSAMPTKTPWSLVLAPLRRSDTRSKTAAFLSMTPACEPSVSAAVARAPESPNSVSILPPLLPKISMAVAARAVGFSMPLIASPIFLNASSGDMLESSSADRPTRARASAAGPLPPAASASAFCILLMVFPTSPAPIPAWSNAVCRSMTLPVVMPVCPATSERAPPRSRAFLTPAAATPSAANAAAPAAATPTMAGFRDATDV